ncbi:DUF5615 family PIN-like protein [Microbulbifer spongiae]|uniref:DUF5615 family PIN-like protein n=1 Tax=Microbulbifer spongiae TaxID=2944933 RepID=A0ABY9ED81_9GAMM|nr:DUF5615 family PIN-like protein [Microbulbifer sp. MI-G]WKD50607.1 DUF5615 family PIN-like protein [Microbulbifer sp. MI-G]
MLFIDESLSYRLAARLATEFAGTLAVPKVAVLGEGSRDSRVWEYAQEHNLALLTKDKDFVDYWRRFGPPPKVIRLDIGNNMQVRSIETLMKTNKRRVLEFLAEPKAGLLVLIG